MEQSGQLATDQQDFDVITQAKRFMDADESEKTAILDGMSTVKDLKSILPVDLSTWSKSTTTQVLQKALNLFEIPRSTEDKSYEDVQWEQNKLQRRLDELKAKKAENEWILEEHRMVKEQRENLFRLLFQYLMSYEPMVAAYPDWEDPGLKQHFRDGFNAAQQDLSQLKSPLRD